MDKAGFEYGCFGDTLKEQAIKQGFELKDSDKFEKIRKAINMCGFHVATNSQVDMMFKKSNKQVVENLIKNEEAQTGGQSVKTDMGGAGIPCECPIIN